VTSFVEWPIEEARNQFDQAQCLDFPERSNRPVPALPKIWLNLGPSPDYDRPSKISAEADEELDSDKNERGANWWDEWTQVQLERMHLFYWLGMSTELNALTSNVQPELGSPRHFPSPRQIFLSCSLSRSSLTPLCAAGAGRSICSRAVTELSHSDNPNELGHARFAFGFVMLWRGELERPRLMS